MFTQGCKWGGRDTNPAQWADPPTIPNTTPVVPDPEQVQRLMEAAKRSRRPEYARALFITATTGVRRAELCALRRDVDWKRGVMTVTWSILELPREPLREIPTKNRRARPVVLDEATLAALRQQVDFGEALI